MNKIKSAILLAIALTAGTASAQDTAQSAISTFPADIKLAPRSALIPYPSKDAAIEGAPDSSPWFIAITDWRKETAGGNTRYSARIKIPRTWDGRAVILRTGGVTSSFEVEMNGATAGYSRSGMSRAEFDLTGFARQDYNDISIIIQGNSAAAEVENHRSRDTLAIGGAALISQPMVRIRDLAAETSVSDGTGLLSLAVIMQSHLRNPKECVVSYELISPDGSTVAQASRDLTTGWMSADTLRFAAAVPGVKRWNHETPHLYTIVAKIFQEGRFTEYISAAIGFRSVAYGGGSLLVDGVEVPVYNTGFGWQGGMAETMAGLHSLKALGFNCVTVPGCPQPDAFYRACDETGMYVCDAADINTGKGPKEITRGGNRSNDPAWLEVFVSRAMEMLLSSRIHPSVVMLSPGTGSPNGYCLYESYMALKKGGMGRPVIYPEAGGQWNNDPVRMLSPEERRSDVWVDGARLAGEGVVCVENNMALTPLKGIVTYRIMQGNSAKHTGSAAVDIPPGGRFPLTIPAAASAKAKKHRSLEVSVAVNHVDYCLPAPASDGRRTKNGPEAVMMKTSIEY
jgi:beta-galactosidase